MQCSLVKASVHFHQVTWCHISEDCALQSKLSELEIQQTYVWGHVYCHGLSRRLYNTKHYTVMTLFWHNVNQWLAEFDTTLPLWVFTKPLCPLLQCLTD